ncbi:hypothetical protein WAI453_004928 [Rhynchosporium graminicola]|uniref:Uncharacterized protein n=1 Tax=Rhynchosporium graminicola TaxID=2792576 RepID=A0A1E1L513_9HELO|nr:uncharacterized protein RCO7_08423 [Rhynchosporium commune]
MTQPTAFQYLPSALRGILTSSKCKHRIQETLPSTSESSTHYRRRIFEHLPQPENLQLEPAPNSSREAYTHSHPAILHSSPSQNPRNSTRRPIIPET